MAGGGTTIMGWLGENPYRERFLAAVVFAALAAFEVVDLSRGGSDRSGVLMIGLFGLVAAVSAVNGFRLLRQQRLARGRSGTAPAGEIALRVRTTRDQIVAFGVVLVLTLVLLGINVSRAITAPPTPAGAASDDRTSSLIGSGFYLLVSVFAAICLVLSIRQHRREAPSSVGR